MTPGDLTRDTAVTPLPAAPGWYTASLPDAWSYVTPSGGVLMTVALQAIRAEVGDPGMHPVSATTLFCSPVPAGPLEIRVETIRKGGAAMQLRAALSSTTLPGPGLEVSATFSRVRQGPEVTDLCLPDLPHPDVARRLSGPRRDGRPTFPFFENFDGRHAIGHDFGEQGWLPTDARFARWFRYLTPVTLPDGTLDPLAIPPIADTMPPALLQKLGPDHPRFHAPSLDLTVHFLQPTRSSWLLVDARARCARAGYASASVDVWGDDGSLVAFGTQTMFLRSRR